ncbi:MAG: hypothetical protein CM1200mP30_27590 [Pseudomonadota bacterium]|nr:MAG: hypothetical protein CM1200mP30_27590 [Pseudomonadota bacterium]
MRIHSQRPHTMGGASYAVSERASSSGQHTTSLVPGSSWSFHKSAEQLRVQFYHHCTNMRRLLKDDERFAVIENSLRGKAPEEAFSGKELALMRYTKN